MSKKRPGVAIAPPRYECTQCHVSHGGCALLWIKTGMTCCDTCQHIRRSTPHNPETPDRDLTTEGAPHE